MFFSSQAQIHSRQWLPIQPGRDRPDDPCRLATPCRSCHDSAWLCPTDIRASYSQRTSQAEAASLRSSSGPKMEMESAHIELPIPEPADCQDSRLAPAQPDLSVLLTMERADGRHSTQCPDLAPTNRIKRVPLQYVYVCLFAHSVLYSWQQDQHRLVNVIFFSRRG
jgi:hypothetical protein